MSNRDIGMHVFSLILISIALWLLYEISWRAATGVFLFVWGNNLIYSTRLKTTIKKGLWK